MCSPFNYSQTVHISIYVCIIIFISHCLSTNDYHRHNSVYTGQEAGERKREGEGELEGERERDAGGKEERDIQNTM